MRGIWLDETPEERVRQEYLCQLVNEYGYALDQIEEERSVTGRGSAAARADFLIWRSAQAKAQRELPLVVVECKADNVTIDQRTYDQGANYAQYARAPFFVTHNNRETKFWKVDLEKLAPNFAPVADIPHANDSDRQIEELKNRLKPFKEDEFAALLRQCHNVIRNAEKLDAADAFDEIAKVLFVKVYVERELRKNRARQNLFTVGVLRQQIGAHPLNDLFQRTKQEFERDRIFAPDDTIKLKPTTAERLVELLEGYNLSETSEDIKGIAFEKFLGRTYRDELGQFFTPRGIVEFMIRMVAPREGEIICDPASGSGGFLIRFFELVRQQILADADREYEAFKAHVEGQNLPPDEMARRLRDEYDRIQATTDQRIEGSRMWNLANRCIYGTDANGRLARTSKMNMILHGDGHGGIHHHDGFLNVNGIFEQRFDIVLTNPPFGANVEATDRIQEAEAVVSDATEQHYTRIYGDVYREAQARVRAKIGQPIATLFTLPKIEERKKGDAKVGKIKTEILFIERCLSLLKPGGRLMIVLPEGIFNNPSLAYVREFCEDRAFVRAVVSLPQETFVSSGASVKASLLYLEKFTDAEQAGYDEKRRVAEAERRAAHAPAVAETTARLQDEAQSAKQAKDTERAKAAAASLRAYLKRVEEQIKTEARALVKERFDYPVFLYDAQKVGITATGEEDENELYPNPRVPAGLGKTCLELFRDFRENPEAFFLSAATDEENGTGLGAEDGIEPDEGEFTE